MNIDIDAVKKYIIACSDNSAIYVGCDSKVGGNKVTFVRVVVVHIDQCRGAKVFWEAITIKGRMDLRSRLYKEAELAIDLAMDIRDVVGDRPFALHLDVNKNSAHRSNIVYADVVGWATGLGFDVVTKPDSFGASACADHFANKSS